MAGSRLIDDETKVQEVKRLVQGHTSIAEEELDPRPPIQNSWSPCPASELLGSCFSCLFCSAPLSESQADPAQAPALLVPLSFLLLLRIHGQAPRAFFAPFYPSGPALLPPDATLAP